MAIPYESWMNILPIAPGWLTHPAGVVTVPATKSELTLVGKQRANRVENDLKQADASIDGYSGALGRILKVTVAEDEGAYHLLHRIQAIAQEALTGKR